VVLADREHVQADSSVFCAIWVIASIPSASLGVSPDTGPGDVATEKIPNCIALASDICFAVSEPPEAPRYSGRVFMIIE